jgi:ATP-dependent protease ClpP protease subunit
VPNWQKVMEEIGQRQQLMLAAASQASANANAAADLVRRQYLQQLHAKTGRNVIAYYSAWLSKGQPQFAAEVGISDEDKNGFMMAVHGLDRSKGLDLFLHTPGGGVQAAHSIVTYLRQMFTTDIRAVVPQIALSAGTMIACCCRAIMMAKHSSLGPIDPQLRGIPAAGVIEEFKRAAKEMIDPAKARVWQPILAQYRPTFLSQCENGVKLAKTFVRHELETCMFASESKARAKAKAKRIVDKLSDYSGNKAHDRHIDADECERIGLTVERIEADAALQDLILTVHHCYMHSTANTPVIKVIENHQGAAWMKAALPVQQVQQVPR